jgi:hypothetical protein
MADEAELLVYQVKEPGVDSYISRILVNKSFLRLDEGGAPGESYTIYDRQQKKIFNVDPGEKTVLEMSPPTEQPQVPEQLVLNENLSADPDSPKVAGKQPWKLSLQTNGESCRELVVIEDTLPESVAALTELYQALARMQYPNIHAPGNNQSDCELTEYVYAPQRAFIHGLPLWDVMGQKQRLLVDFKKSFSVDEDLFSVPEDFELVVPAAWK